MTQSVKKMPTPGGIGAGQTATVSLPLGLTYETMFIRMNVDVGDPAVATDVPVDDWDQYIDEIRLLVDGNVKLQVTADFLVKLNKRYQQPMVAGTLPLFLSRPWMRSIGGEDQTSYKTGPHQNGAASVSTFTMEMDVKDGVAVNQLEVYAQQSPGQPWGSHIEIHRYTHPQGLIGEAEISNLPKGPYHMLALHIDTDAIKRAEVLANNAKIIDYDKPVRDAFNVLQGRADVAGFTMLDFCTKNRAVEALPMLLQDFRLKLDFTSTGNYSIYAESVVGAAGR